MLELKESEEQNGLIVQAHSVRQLPRYHFKNQSHVYISETSGDIIKEENNPVETIAEEIDRNVKNGMLKNYSDLRKTTNWTAIRTSANDNRDTHLDSRKLVESELSNVQEFAKSKSNLLTFLRARRAKGIAQVTSALNRNPGREKQTK